MSPQHLWRRVAVAGVTPLIVVLQFTPTPPLSEAQTCPKPGSPTAQFVPDGLDDTFEQQILDFLNAGGSPERLASAIRALAIPFRSYQKEYLEVTFNLIQQDLTGDGIQELILSSGFTGFYQGESVEAAIHGLALACRGGSYQRIRFFRFAEVLRTGDLTGDGLPELLVQQERSAVDGWLYVYQWQGDDLHQLTVDRTERFGDRVGVWIEPEWAVPLQGLELRDADRDGKLEVLFNRPAYPLSETRLARSGPRRDRREVWGWNGTSIGLERWEHSPPQYRFQAVQDGDDLTRFGDLDRALTSYRRAIGEDRLKPFQLFRTPASILRRYGAPAPASDPTERQRLAAYARFRLVLIHLLQGDDEEAETELRSLQEAHPEGDPGQAFSEMAQAFWDAYVSEREIESGCEAAVDYAIRHANEVLIPLGSSNYGYRNRDYLPEDICPFEDGAG
jgi:hypothetical protein